MKPTHYLTLFLGVILILSSPACGPKEKVSEVEYPAVVEESDGVRTVHNPDYPKEGTFRYDLNVELSLGGPEAEGDAILVRPIQFAFDTLGNVYIMDWQEITIKVFDPKGNYLRSVSKKGQGPGEFDVPAYFRIVDDLIYLLDSRSRKFSLLSLEGEFLRGFNIDGFPPDFDVAPDGTIYYSRMLTPEMELDERMQKMKSSFVLFQTDVSGEERIERGEYPDVVQLKRQTRSPSGQMSGITLTSRESYTTSWLVGPDGRVYIGYNRDYELEVRDKEWNLVLKFGRDFARLPHPSFKPDGPHPEFYPAFSDWRKFFDEKGNLWLEQYPNTDVEDHVFDVFSPDGIYLRKVIVPAVLYHVKGDTAYGFARDEEDYVIFKRYKMVPVEEKKT